MNGDQRSDQHTCNSGQHGSNDENTHLDGTGIDTQKRRGFRAKGDSQDILTPSGL